MTVKELYDSIGGNYEKAVQTMMNDAFIVRMLSKFIAKNAYADIIASYEQMKVREVFEASHSLKGVSGNLSLTSLYEKAGVICEATRTLNEGDSVNLDKEIEELKEVYQRVKSGVEAYLNQ